MHCGNTAFNNCQRPIRYHYFLLCTSSYNFCCHFSHWEKNKKTKKLKLHCTGILCRGCQQMSEPCVTYTNISQERIYSAFQTDNQVLTHALTTPTCISAVMAALSADSNPPSAIKLLTNRSIMKRRPGLTLISFPDARK